MAIFDFIKNWCENRKIKKRVNELFPTLDQLVNSGSTPVNRTFLEGLERTGKLSGDECIELALENPVGLIDLTRINGLLEQEYDKFVVGTSLNRFKLSQRKPKYFKEILCFNAFYRVDEILVETYKLEDIHGLSPRRYHERSNTSKMKDNEVKQLALDNNLIYVGPMSLKDYYNEELEDYRRDRQENNLQT